MKNTQQMKEREGAKSPNGLRLWSEKIKGKTNDHRFAPRPNLTYPNRPKQSLKKLRKGKNPKRPTDKNPGPQDHKTCAQPPLLYGHARLTRIEFLQQLNPAVKKMILEAEGGVELRDLGRLQLGLRSRDRLVRIRFCLAQTLAPRPRKTLRRPGRPFPGQTLSDATGPCRTRKLEAGAEEVSG